MANATKDLTRRPVGRDGHTQRLPVAAATTIYSGTLVSQLTATGGLCPTSTANSGPALGVAQHGADNSSGTIGLKEVLVEMERVHLFRNHTSNAFTKTSLVGSIAYAIDDHTVASTGTVVAGLFMGLDEGEGVRVYVGPTVNAGVTLPAGGGA